MSLLTFHSLYVHGRLHSACRGIGNSWFFDDVISAYVFGLPDSERCAGAVQHSEDKATIILINLETKFCFGRN